MSIISFAANEVIV